MGAEALDLTGFAASFDFTIALPDDHDDTDCHEYTGNGAGKKRQDIAVCNHEPGSQARLRDGGEDEADDERAEWDAAFLHGETDNAEGQHNPNIIHGIG